MTYIKVNVIIFNIFPQGGFFSSWRDVIKKFMLTTRPFFIKKKNSKQLTLNISFVSEQKISKLKFPEGANKLMFVPILVSFLFSAQFALAYDGNISKLMTWISQTQYEEFLNTLDTEIENIEFVTEQYKTGYVVGESAFSAPLVPPRKKQEIIENRVRLAVTAYSSTLDQTDSSPFITASGTRVRDGVIAANFLPIGTKVKIPSVFGDKTFVVEDRMNRRYWHRLDIWMPSRAQALQFGIRTLEIEVLN